MEGNHAHLSMQSRRTTTVILFGGLPASGKSTLARSLIKEFGNEAIHLEYDELEDAIVLLQINQERRDAWNQARKLAMNKLEFHLIQAKSNEESPSILLMDDNFHLRGMRKQIHRLLLNYKPINFGIIWMQTPIHVCLERNRQRERIIPSHVFEKMKKAMEPPRTAWEDYAIHVHEYTPFETVKAFVDSCPAIVDIPETVSEEQQHADREQTLKSSSHNWDNLLRGWVAKIAKYDKRLAQNANQARKDIMKLTKEPAANFTVNDLMSQFVRIVIADEEKQGEMMQCLNHQ